MVSYARFSDFHTPFSVLWQRKVHVDHACCSTCHLMAVRPGITWLEAEALYFENFLVYFSLALRPSLRMDLLVKTDVFNSKAVHMHG